MSKREEIELALAALELIRKEHDEARKINKMLRKFDGGDFAPQISSITSNMESAVVKLIDHILDPNSKEYPIGSYWLYEAPVMKGGGSITVNDKSYRIKTINDVRKYVYEVAVP